MSESSFYKCCGNFGTHTAECARQAARGGAPMSQDTPTPTCLNCTNWDRDEREVKADLKRKRKRPHYDSNCRKLAEFIHYAGGCGECDPYSMNTPEVQTPPTFSCAYFEPRSQP